MQMKKRLLSLLLVCSIVLTLLSTAALATEPVPEEIPAESEEDSGIALASSYTDVYPVTGGNIYFDASTGTITDADTTVIVVEIPSSINGTCVKRIGTDAFEYCYSLSSITIPNTVTDIGNRVFSNCRNLTSITIPNSVTYIGDYTFKNCYKLSSVIISDNAAFIGSYAFYNCYNLTNITIPDTVTSIFSYAFYGCSSLSSVTIPDRVTSIGSYAFYGCDSLLSVTIPDSVTYIGSYAFYGCENLLSVTISDSVTDIEEYVFYGCDSLLSVTIPDSVIYIRSYAFYGCDRLSGVSIGKNVTSIEISAFRECDSLSSIKVAEDNVYYSSENGVLFNKEQTWLIQYPVGAPATSYTIPDSVTSIGSYAFYNCYNLTNITIPDSITFISNYAFYGCKNLLSVIIPDSVTDIAEYTFYGCDRLSSVTIPDSITSIGRGAFKYCFSLTSVTIPDSVADIAESAFYGCDSLSSVTIPDGVTIIQSSAFADCGSLTSVTIGNSITCIWEGTFSSCPKLTNVTIPASVINIEHAAFAECDRLTDVYYGGTKKDWEDVSIGSSNAPLTSATIHYSSTYPQNQCYYITSLEPEGIEINGAGSAIAHFQVTDQDDVPQTGVFLFYSIDGDRQSSTITDGNGVLSVSLGNVASKDYTLQFTPPDSSISLSGNQQTVTVTVPPLSTTQKWTGTLGGSASFGVGGLEAEVGVASFKASLASAVLAGSLNCGLSLEHTYESDGSRTLELTINRGTSVGIEGGTGIGATTPVVEVEVVGTSAGAFLGAEASTGIRIKNYNPTKAEFRDSVARFLASGILPVLGHRSVFYDHLSQLMYISSLFNQSAYTEIVSLDAGASLLSLQIGQNDVQAAVTLAGLDGETVYSHQVSEDLLENKTTYTANAVTELGMGLGRLDGIVVGAGKTDTDNNIFGSAGTETYVLGANVSNAASISAQFDAHDTLSGISYTVYDEKGTQNIILGKTVTEISSTVSYGKEEADKIIKANSFLNSFVSGNRSLLKPDELVSSVTSMSTGNYLGTAQERLTEKTGWNLNIPLALSAGVKAGVELSGGFMEEYSYTTGSGLLMNGAVYTTTVSNISDEALASQRYELLELLAEPLTAIAELITEQCSSVWNDVQEGVQNAYATVTGTVRQWYASIISLAGSDPSTYAILTLTSDDAADTSAAVSLTLGSPYVVAVYTDETMTEPVSDEALAASPLTLTLAYDEDMVISAGAAADASINIYRFDDERNVYILIPNCIQDREKQTVTAAISQQGEYILATDSASPLISEFFTSDQTASPTISVLVSDLSGIEKFSFWVDEGRELVGSDDFLHYYNEASGRFTYQMTGLSSGEHTAYFQASDTLGNANTEPFSFSFTVDAEPPVISNVTILTDTTSEKNGFTAVVTVTDTQLTSVLINIAADGINTISVPMTEGENNLWTADVTGVTGMDCVWVTITATDHAGNRTTTKTYTVNLDNSADSTYLTLTHQMGEDDKVQVTTVNPFLRTVTGWLVCAAYDSSGKMLDSSSVHVELSAQETITCDLQLECELQGHTIKCFLLDVANGYAPMTKQ